jgi:hypothetical protein
MAGFGTEVSGIPTGFRSSHGVLPQLNGGLFSARPTDARRTSFVGIPLLANAARNRAPVFVCSWPLTLGRTVTTWWAGGDAGSTAGRRGRYLTGGFT